MTPADPRPAVSEDAGRQLLLGSRCRACGHALVSRPPRCRRCGGAVDPARFGPEGTIWAVTVVHVAPAPGVEVPYTLAYVDLDDGPRVLVRLDAPRPAAIGERVRMTAATTAGDPMAEVVG